jgi:glycerol-3-phosphate dehydrogenase (NAD(P)+)
VTAWHRDKLKVAEIISTKTLFIASLKQQLPDGIKITSNLSECRDVDLTIIALPAAAWHEVLHQLAPKSIVISATKGLEKTTKQTPLTFAHQTLAIPNEKLCVLSGPSFAKDLATGTPLSLVAASASAETAQKVASALSSKSVRIYTSNDPLGVELGGILKNIVAIAVGIADSLSYGPSTRAALITRGLSEMTRIATALGADRQTLYGLSGLGDLVMTSTDDQSRNRMVGLRLGRGETIDQIVSSLGSIAEGASSTELVASIAAQRGIEAPITDLVREVLNGRCPPGNLAERLMLRPLRGE